MLLPAVLLLVGVVAGLLRGGRLANISTVRFRRPWLVFVGLGLQLGAQAASGAIPAIQKGSAGPIVLAVSYAFVLWFVALNFRFPGTVFIGLGLLLNLTVIMANGAMPVSLGALHAAGVKSLPGLQTGVKHHPMGPGTWLGFLGDVIPAPPLGIVSVGDIVLGTGVMVLVYRLVLYRPRRSIDLAAPAREPSGPPPPAGAAGPPAGAAGPPEGLAGAPEGLAGAPGIPEPPAAAS